MNSSRAIERTEYRNFLFGARTHTLRADKYWSAFTIHRFKWITAANTFNVQPCVRFSFSGDSNNSSIYSLPTSTGKKNVSAEIIKLNGIFVRCVWTRQCVPVWTCSVCSRLKQFIKTHKNRKEKKNNFFLQRKTADISEYYKIYKKKTHVDFELFLLCLLPTRMWFSNSSRNWVNCIFLLLCFCSRSVVVADTDYKIVELWIRKRRLKKEIQMTDISGPLAHQLPLHNHRGGLVQPSLVMNPHLDMGCHVNDSRISKCLAPFKSSAFFFLLILSEFRVWRISFGRVLRRRKSRG